MILCDTNVLIELYRGNTGVTDILKEAGVANLSISVVTSGELYYGARDKRELRKIQKHLALLQQIPLDDEISGLFLKLLEEFALSHHLNIPDALIAATAIRHSLPLYTLNVRDFRFLPGLHIYRE